MTELYLLVAIWLVFIGLFFVLFMGGIPMMIKKLKLYQLRGNLLIRVVHILISLVTSAVIGTFVFVVFLVFYLQVTDKDAQWWSIEEPVRAEVGQLRHVHQLTGKYPDEASFIRDYGQKLSVLKGKANLRYIYDPVKDNFVILVRPIKGDYRDTILIYSSLPGIEFDRTSFSGDRNDWPAQGHKYPPAIPGPWDQVPQ